MNFIYALLMLLPVQPEADSLPVHELQQVVVSGSVKHNGRFAEEPLSVSSFTGARLEAQRINEPKDLSFIVPNFMQADYGSKMTSSVYMRGIGARMEQPAVGLYIDNIPILNKNNYDQDLYDLSRVYVLRGPQGTLYGRNTIGGVIDMHTLSPMHYQGTRLHAGYGNANSSELRVSTYQRPSEKFAFSVALNHMYTDGFFTNEYDGSPADRCLSESARVKVIALLDGGWSLENTLFANYVRQKGFAYSLYDEQTGAVSPINHNDPCSYERVNVTDGLTFRYEESRFRFSSTTSYQFTDDDMRLDQDFLPASMFTLRQAQREHAATQEFVFRSHDTGRWQWITGAFGFYKHGNMDAPVTFKRDGIDELILDNANEKIKDYFSSDYEILIEEDSFPIESAFKLPVFGISLYHQSSWQAGRWKFTAGLRADYEHTAIKYSNGAVINYMFTATPDAGDYSALPVRMSGRQSKQFFELMPHLSASFDTGAGIVYASATRGYKSGGYNTQIFSDILQNKMMLDMMADIGVYPDGPGAYNVDEAISYKPEYSWNYEAGAHLEWLDGRLAVDAALFYIDLRDQQITVFPPGQTTGRMMSNAGRSRSCGAELSISYRAGRFLLAGNYGYTNAKFIEYTSGDNDWSDLYVPYVPQNTVSAMCEYRQPLPWRWADDIVLNVSWQGAGPIYWNEANTATQPFYGLLNASATLNMRKVAVSLWGRNITNTEYYTFYFKSVGNSFVQRGKPLRFGITLDINL